MTTRGYWRGRAALLAIVAATIVAPPAGGLAETLAADAAAATFLDLSGEWGGRTRGDFAGMFYLFVLPYSGATADFTAALQRKDGSMAQFVGTLTIDGRMLLGSGTAFDGLTSMTFSVIGKTNAGLSKMKWRILSSDGRHAKAKVRHAS